MRHMQAVVKIGASQFLVSPNKDIVVDRLSSNPDSEVTFSDVLLVIDGENVKVGNPHLAKYQVVAKVVSHPKGPKIRVGKFKAKSRYRKTRGFRSSLTKLHVIDIREN
jgi:large subunit ribosomal protein L21